MTTFNKNGLRLVSQGITGGKIWHYTDTGTMAEVADVAGYFSNASQCGVDTGDLIFIQANNGYTNHTVYGSSFASVQDTGASQGTTGPATLVGDTG